MSLLDRIAPLTRVPVSYQGPDLASTRLGSIPKDWRQRHDEGTPPEVGVEVVPCKESCELGTEPVVRDQPTYDGAGNVVMKETREVLEGRPYSPLLTGTLAGLASGALAAAAGAALANGLVPGTEASAAALGGILGAGLMGITAAGAVAGDRLAVKERAEPIRHFTMTGYKHLTEPDVVCLDDGLGNAWCSLEGWNHTYHPILETKEVGGFQRPFLAHSVEEAQVGPLSLRARLTLGSAIAGISFGVLSALLPLWG